MVDTLLSPVVLFFALGLGAALLRSPMSVPEAFAKGLAIYLMMAIGLKGGVAMSETAIGGDVVAGVLIGVGLSFALPVLAFALLRASSRLSRIDAAATAGHYGSISIVTFVAATDALRLAGVEAGGYVVAVAALMETPAIVTALWLALRKTGERKTGGRKTGGESGGPSADESVAGARGELVREILLNASVVVLIGALAIGWIAGPEGYARLSDFFTAPFQGILCLFMLDMGLNAGRGLRRGWRALGLAPVLFGLYMPLVSAAIALGLAAMAGLPAGDAALLMVLAASASYIAVPAAMRLALPRAEPSIYLTLSLGVTFPFNIAVGIALYIWAAQAVLGA